MKFTLLLSLTTLWTAVLSNLLLDNIVRQLPTRTEPSLFCVIQSAARNDPLEDLYHRNANLGNQQFIASSNYSFNLRNRCSHYFVSFDEHSLSSTEKLLMTFFFGRGWNNRGYFIFLSDLSRNSLNQYGTFVKRFGITNSILIVWGHTLRFFSLNYFEQHIEEFSSVVNAIHHLRTDFLRDVQGDQFRASFLASVPTMVYITQSKLGGSVVKLIQTFAQVMNASIMWDFELSKNPMDELVKVFISSRIDIAPNIFLDHPLIESIPSHPIDSLVLLVPETLKQPFFNQLLMPFSTSVWIFIVLIISSVWTVNQRFKQHFPRNLLMMLFFGSATVEHKLKRTERVIFATLAIILFLLGESYLAIMLSYMLNNKYGSHFLTLADYERSSIPLCTHPGQDSMYLQRLSNEIPMNLNDRVAGISHHHTEWFKVEWCSWLMRYEAAEIFLKSGSNYNSATKRKKFYMIPQHLIFRNRAHSLLRHRPFGTNFSSIQHRIVEGGLKMHWDLFVEENINKQQFWSTFEVFTLANLLSLWYILIYGNLFGAFVLLGELFIHNWNEISRFSKILFNKRLKKLCKSNIFKK